VHHVRRSGVPVVGIYLTAGEADGRNAPLGAEGRKAMPVDFEGYAAARQRGLRAAYGRIAGDAEEAGWERSCLRSPDGVPYERSVLDEGPGVVLYFLNVRMSAPDPAGRFLALWQNGVERQPTVVPVRSPIPPGDHAFTREGLIGTVVDILERHQVTVVRGLDPAPEHTHYEAGRLVYSDHQDHTAAALFTGEAVRRYVERQKDRRVVTENYRGYGNKLWPDNLSGRALAEKMRFIGIYGGTDGRTTLDGVEAGDFQLGDRAYHRGYGQSTAARHARSTSWLQSEADGRLSAFAVLSGAPMRWTESAGSGSAWHGPVPFPGPAAPGSFFSPQLEAVRAADGRLHLFGIRIQLTDDPTGHRRDIVTTAQTEPGSGFGPWRSLGNPHRADTDPAKQREVGLAAALPLHDGGLRVLVRNFSTGLSSRTRAAQGHWGDWTDLGGFTQDGCAWAATPSGGVEVYAGTKKGLLRLSQTSPDGDFVRDNSLQLPPPAGAPTCLRLDDGSLMLLVRQPSTAWVLAYRQSSPGGPWFPQPHYLGGNGGTGPVAAVLTPGRLEPGQDGFALAKRNDLGTVSLSWQSLEPAPIDPAWIDGGPNFVQSPSISLDAERRVVAAVIAVDGFLHVNRQRTAEPGCWPGGWEKCGQ
jgi:hypothetical protein